MIFKRVKDQEAYVLYDVYTSDKHLNPNHYAGFILDDGNFEMSEEHVELSIKDMEEIVKKMKEVKKGMKK